jgi:hypothetical protein
LLSSSFLSSFSSSFLSLSLSLMFLSSISWFLQHFRIDKQSWRKWKNSRQIVIFINVVLQLVSITKFKLKRKLIIMFSTSEDFIIDTQRVSSKQIVRFTKRAQIIRIEFVKIKKTVTIIKTWLSI